MTDPTERLEHFATNDTAHGGDCETPADIIEADDYPLLPETMEREFVPRACLMDGSDCGCSLCPPAPDPALQDVFAYLRAVKRFGLALEQLGRPCDKERP